jgi:hypothetical protein
MVNIMRRDSILGVRGMKLGCSIKVVRIGSSTEQGTGGRNSDNEED